MVETFFGLVVVFDIGCSDGSGVVDESYVGGVICPVCGREVHARKSGFVGSGEVVEVEAAKESDFTTCIAESAEFVFGLENVLLCGGIGKGCEESGFGRRRRWRRISLLSLRIGGR